LSLLRNGCFLILSKDPMETIRKVYQVERHEINYLRITIESYDGMALVRTLDPDAALIEIRISPGCEQMVHELLDHVKRDEHMKISEIQNSTGVT